jgi:Tfp pilus assembly protein PilF
MIDLEAQSLTYCQKQRKDAQFVSNGAIQRILKFWVISNAVRTGWKRMKKVFKLVVSFFALFLLLCSNVAASDDWVEIRSKNFSLVGNASVKDIRIVATRLERFRLAFSKVYEKFNFESEIPTTVIVFKDQNSFRQFKPVRNGKTKDWVAGFFQASEDVNYIVLSIDSEKTQTYQTIFHEYVHFLIKNTLKRAKIPAWLNEGLAEYYENLEIRNEMKVRLGCPQLSHIKTLQTKNLIPPEEFFEEDFELIENQPNEVVSLYYPQAWALVHYLIHGNSGKRKFQLQKFLELLAEGRLAKEAFSSAFHSDYDAIENELRAYIARNSFSSIEIHLETKLESVDDFKVSKISAAKAKSIQGDLLYRMNRLDEAETVLEEALLLDSNEEFGNIALGLVNMKQGEFDVARKYLENVISFGSKNYLAYYYHAYVLSRSTVTDRRIINAYDPQTVKEMRQSLRKAIELNPKFADSYHLFAVISIVQNEDLDTGLEMINKAIALKPGDEMFWLRKGELLLRKKDFENSRRIAKDIASKTSDESIRGFAENLTAQLSVHENQAEISSKINEGNIYVVKEGESLTPRELAELNQRIEIDSINNNLRKPLEGESRVIGRVNKINCSKNGVEFLVNANESEIRFVSKTFTELIFYTYQIQLKGGSIGCESDLSKFKSIITYKTSKGFGEANDELVSIEFVPEYFEFRK